MRGVWNLRAISETYIRLMEITLILAALVWASMKTGHPVLWIAFVLGLVIFFGHVAMAFFHVMIWGVAQLPRKITFNVPAGLFFGFQLVAFALSVAFVVGYIRALVALARALQA